MALFESSTFIAHAGQRLAWKIEADALSKEDLATIASIVGAKIEFGDVYGIPRGGIRMAEALRPYSRAGRRALIVDDVLTTGTSMKVFCDELGIRDARGFVIFARGPCPIWVDAFLALNSSFGP